MSTRFRQIIGCWLNERWRLEVALSPALSRVASYGWIDLCNRRESLLQGSGESRLCAWTDSSFLTVARIFPETGGRLLRHVLEEWPVRLEEKPKPLSSRPDISVVIPAGGPERSASLQCVVSGFAAQTFRNAEIVVVEYGSAGNASLRPRGVKHILLEAGSGKQFNKSRAMNEGVRQSVAPVVLLHDADIVPPAIYLERIVETLAEGWEALRPLRFLFCFDEESSADFCGSRGSSLPARVRDVMQNFPGGSTAVRKDVYWEIGGHDEDFEGWGGEDLEFLDRLAMKKLYGGGFAPAIHLWHRQARKKETGDRNNLLMSEKRKRSPEERARCLRQGASGPA